MLLRGRVILRTMRGLQLLYTLGCTVWAVYLVRAAVAGPEATLSGAVNCVLLLVVLPSLLGYVLLFRAVPWLGRLIRR